jgi:hypothetical protein
LILWVTFPFGLQRLLTGMLGYLLNDSSPEELVRARTPVHQTSYTLLITGRPLGGLFASHILSFALMTEPHAPAMLDTKQTKIRVGKTCPLRWICKEENPAMISKKPATPKLQVKRPSKGFRKYQRRQKQAVRKLVGVRV